MTSDCPVPDWPTLRDRHRVFENDAVLILNKPPGISVMGERHDTDVVRLAEDAGERLMPVHRIDKVTSGVVLFAKSVEVHGGLTRQFNQRTVDKAYLAITRSPSVVGPTAPNGAKSPEPARELPERGTIDLPLSVGRKNRVRVAAPRDSIVVDEGTDRWSVPPSQVFRDKRSYPSLTVFARVWAGGHHNVLVARPVTGRRHQLRVHLAWIGHAIEGDPLFDKGTTAGRTFLHSWRLAFDATWSDGARVHVEAPPGPDFWEPVPAFVPGDILARAREGGHTPF